MLNFSFFPKSLLILLCCCYCYLNKFINLLLFKPHHAWLMMVNDFLFHFQTSSLSSLIVHASLSSSYTHEKLQIFIYASTFSVSWIFILFRKKILVFAQRCMKEKEHCCSWDRHHDPPSVLPVFVIIIICMTFPLWNKKGKWTANCNNTDDDHDYDDDCCVWRYVLLFFSLYKSVVRWNNNAFARVAGWCRWWFCCCCLTLIKGKTQTTCFPACFWLGFFLCRFLAFVDGGRVKPVVGKRAMSQQPWSFAKRCKNEPRGWIGNLRRFCVTAATAVEYWSEKRR